MPVPFETLISEMVGLGDVEATAPRSVTEQPPLDVMLGSTIIVELVVFAAVYDIAAMVGRVQLPTV